MVLSSVFWAGVNSSQFCSVQFDHSADEFQISRKCLITIYTLLKSCSVFSIEVEDISGSGSIYVQSDGEHLGFLPRKFCILPSAIQMIC